MHSQILFLSLVTIAVSTIIKKNPSELSGPSEVWQSNRCPESCVCELRYSARLSSTLRTVDCSNKDLSSFPESEALPSDVQVLLVGHNRIQRLSPELRLWLPDLIHLDLSHNVLLSVEFSSRFSMSLFEGLYNLLLVDLSHNHIRKLGNNAFQGLFNLKELDLTHNRISAIMDDAFKGLTKLETLRLSENKLTFLQHSWWENIRDLFSLYLNDNRLSLVQADSFKPLRQLISLDLSKNSIFRLSDNAFFGLNKLETLAVAYNTLTTIPQAILAYLRTTLKSINLSRNPIFKLATDDFANLSQLKDVTLTSMPRLRLVERGAFKNLPQLLVVQMHDSPHLAYLDDAAFVNTPQVTHLLLHNNNLSLVQPKTLASLPSLQEMSFYGNPLACDCNARWLKEKLSSPSLDIRFVEAERMVCDSPSEHKFRLFVSLTPQDLPRQCPPRMLHMFDNSNSRKLGGEVVLDCRAVGVPQPRITWIAPNGAVIAASAYHPRRSLRNKNTLVLRHVNLEDAGLYTCVAESDAGHVAVQTTVEVSNIDVQVVPLEVDATSATVGWRGRDRARNIFQILYRETATMDAHRYAGTVTPIMKNFLIANLRPNTEYEICIAIENNRNLLSHISCAVLTTKNADFLVQTAVRSSNVAVGVALAIVASMLILICLAAVGLKRGDNLRTATVSTYGKASYDNFASVEQGMPTLFHGHLGAAYSLDRVPLHFSNENVYSPLVSCTTDVKQISRLQV